MYVFILQLIPCDREVVYVLYFTLSRYKANPRRVIILIRKKSGVLPVCPSWIRITNKRPLRCLLLPLLHRHFYSLCLWRITQPPFHSLSRLLWITARRTILSNLSCSIFITSDILGYIRRMVVETDKLGNEHRSMHPRNRRGNMEYMEDKCS